MSGAARSPSRRPGHRSWIPLAILLAVLAGCSASNESGVGFLDSEGKHPADIVATHMDYAQPDGSSCRSCHGPDLHGGISGVSCFTADRNGQGCHADGPDFVEGPEPFHPAGFSEPTTHGPPPKRAPAGTNGFSYCQICHGSLFNGGTSAVSCYTCHTVNAPHPKRPWTGGTFTHTNTDGGNAPVCAECHLGGQNSTRQPDLPAPSGTPPGCFNNTLCHGSFGPPEPFHPAGWDKPATHGPPAKGAPGGTSGFPHCQTCHGNRFDGGSADVSCYTCHKVDAPHPKRPWQGGTFTHTNVNGGNASVCALCHRDGANSTRKPGSPAPPGTEPGCFNNTLCHNGAGGPEPEMHAVPFYDHAAEARDRFQDSCSACHKIKDPSVGPACRSCHKNGDPLTTTGCRSCHGNPPDGSSYPNVAGTHKSHDALPGVKENCGVCHRDAGSGTRGNHFYDQQVDVKIASAYDAKGGDASYSSGGRTCAEVSCHGGQTTPDWRQENAISVNAQCEKCHALGTAQYNSYFSGDHALHLLGKNADDDEVDDDSVTSLIDPTKTTQVKGCTDCHSKDKLAESHFTALDTPTMEGPASATVGGDGTKIPQGNWNPVTKSCNPTCHGTQTW